MERMVAHPPHASVNDLLVDEVECREQIRVASIHLVDAATLGRVQIHHLTRCASADTERRGR